MANFIALIVEDDALQRTFLADLLKGRDLEVIECTTAEAAELVLATAGRELKVVVTDVNLDGEMSGVQLAEFAKQTYPRLNVIVLSGREAVNLPLGTCFLRKPCTAGELLRAVFG
jgi:DNA-binding NtrC family response regulator